MASRTRNPDQADLAALLDDGAVLRTHVLRPTWHFVRAEDIGWVLDLTGPRVRRVTGQQLRDTHGLDDKNPYDFEYIKARIEHALREFEGRFAVVPLPNITHVFYGRDVGYAVERIDLDQSVQDISATELRKKLSAGT